MGRESHCDADGRTINVRPVAVGDPRKLDENTTVVELRYPEGTRLKGKGDFRLDLLLYDAVGMDLRQMRSSTLTTMEFPPKIVTPFLIMFVVSLLTRPNSKEALDRYYAKMKTPVDPDPEQDEKNLKAAYAKPEITEQKKLFPGTSLEFQRPNMTDILGFVICVIICFAVIGIAVWMANIGA